jgi:hypothetical protein
MPIILRDLPFFVSSSTAVFQGRYIPIRSDQIIVWVGITEPDQTEFHPVRPFFPAVLDTGHTHNFSIREDHLIRWAGLDPRSLNRRGTVQIGDERLLLYKADVWIRSNVRGERDRPDDRAPFCLELDSGIAVYPRTLSAAPRLPVLGLRALRWANLHLTVNGRRRLVSLRTTRKSWFF